MTARRMLPSLQFGLALSMAALGDWPAAEEVLRRTVQAAERIDDAEFALRARIQLCDLLLRSGRPGGPELLRVVGEQAAQRLAANGRLPFSIQASLGRAWLAGGDPQAALAPLAAARAARSLENASPAMAELLRDQSEALAAVGRLDDAAEALDQARRMRERLRPAPAGGLRDEAVAEARLLLARGQARAAAERLAPHAAEPAGLSPAGLALQVLRVRALRAACDLVAAREVAAQARRDIEASPLRSHLAAGEDALAREAAAIDSRLPACAATGRA